MKKIFTLIAVAAMALSASAQEISFTEGDVVAASTSAPLNNKTFSNGSFSITITDGEGKFAIDPNNAYFGDATAQTKYSYRLKTGGKSQTNSGKERFITLNAPSAGTVKVCARSASSSTVRSIEVNGKSQSLDDANAISVDMEGNISETNPTGATKVYPVYEFSVAAGANTINFADGAINIYSLVFVAGEGGGESGGGEGGDTPTPVDGTVLIDYPTSTAGIAASGSTVTATVKIHNNKDAINCYKLANGYTTEGAYNNNSINLTTEGGFKAGDVITIAGAVNVDTSKSENAGKRATAVLFSLDATNNITVLNTFSDFINGRVTSDDLLEESFTLTEDVPALYLGRDGNTGANVTLIKVTRPVPTAISSVTTTATAAAVKKYVENGKVVIVKDGKKFNIAGAQLK